MKIIGVIPARYNASRLPGKPLADICGKPMIWWVYRQAKKVDEFDEVYVATDDERIAAVCKDLGMVHLMTRNDTPNHIHRIWEVSCIVSADYYVSINGDEPLIEPESIEAVLPAKTADGAPYFGSIYRIMTSPDEVLDPSNVKIVLDVQGKCLYQSRAPIPYPKTVPNYEYKKAIGTECFNKQALDFFVEAPMSDLETIEDIDHLRFVQNGISIHYRQVYSNALSVDTANDLEIVRRIIADQSNSDKAW